MNLHDDEDHRGYGTMIGKLSGRRITIPDVNAPRRENITGVTGITSRRLSSSAVKQRLAA